MKGAFRALYCRRSLCTATYTALLAQGSGDGALHSDVGKDSLPPFLGQTAVVHGLSFLLHDRNGSTADNAGDRYFDDYIRMMRAHRTRKRIEDSL